MKTEISDKNNYPFDIEPEAITTHFALFNVIKDGRAEMVLVLSADSVDQVITEREFAFTTQTEQECLAKGYFSYAGGKPNENRWVSKVISVGESMSSTELAAIRNDVWNVVSKLFKGKASKIVTSSEDITTDAEVIYPENQNQDPTQRLGVDLSNIGGETEGMSDEEEIRIQSLQSNSPMHNLGSTWLDGVDEDDELSEEEDSSGNLVARLNATDSTRIIRGSVLKERRAVA